MVRRTKDIRKRGDREPWGDPSGEIWTERGIGRKDVWVGWGVGLFLSITDTSPLNESKNWFSSFVKLIGFQLHDPPYRRTMTQQPANTYSAILYTRVSFNKTWIYIYIYILFLHLYLYNQIGKLHNKHNVRTNVNAGSKRGQVQIPTLRKSTSANQGSSRRHLSFMKHKNCDNITN